ncbi:DUF424 family protein [Candidatus Pacearchaeota archaeon]|nr:DUF424 family protein [Candidatus Pacearchaeota archaeon]
MWVKIHKSSRTVVAICDENLLGKKFSEGIKKLEITESFFKGEKHSKLEVLSIMKYEFKSGSTFNIVGKESVEAAIEAGIIEKEEFSKVKNIPFTIIIN